MGSFTRELYKFAGRHGRSFTTNKSERLQRLNRSSSGTVSTLSRLHPRYMMSAFGTSNHLMNERHSFLLGLCNLKKLYRRLSFYSFLPANFGNPQEAFSLFATVGRQHASENLFHSMYLGIMPHTARTPSCADYRRHQAQQLPPVLRLTDLCHCWHGKSTVASENRTQCPARQTCSWTESSHCQSPTSNALPW